MKDNVGKFLVLNNTIKTAGEFSGIEIDNIGNTVVYEVIRIIDRVPLFFEDHYARLGNSLGSLGLELHVGEQELGEQIRLVVDKNGLVNCNVKVIDYGGNDARNLLLYISKSYYPSDEEFRKGVPVGLIRLERKNPNVKLENHSYRLESRKRIEEANVFEVLLVNHEGKVTEGSKSNVFFIKGEKVYTTPGEYVLKGITRKYIINTCTELGFEVVERLIDVNELSQVDGIFISGTSIKVLPVSAVDGRRYDSAVHPVISAIRERFDRVIDDYIRKHNVYQNL